MNKAILILVFLVSGLSMFSAQAATQVVTCDFNHQESYVNGFQLKAVFESSGDKISAEQVVVNFFPAPQPRDHEVPADSLTLSLRGTWYEIPAGELYKTAVKVIELGTKIEAIETTTTEGVVTEPMIRILLQLGVPAELQSMLVVKGDRFYRANCR